MAAAVSGGHLGQSVAGRRRPLQEAVALFVAVQLPVEVELQRLARAVTVDLHGMIDDQGEGNHRLRGGRVLPGLGRRLAPRSEEHTSELQSLMRISYAVFCLNKKNIKMYNHTATACLRQRL